MVLGQFRAEHLSVSEPPTNPQTNNFTNQSSNDKTTTTITSMIMTFLASGPAHFGNLSARRIAQANQLMVLQQQWSQNYHSWQLLSEVHVTVPSLGYVMKWSWDDPSCSSLEFSESMQVLLLSHTTRNPRIDGLTVPSALSACSPTKSWWRRNPHVTRSGRRTCHFCTVSWKSTECIILQRKK